MTEPAHHPLHLISVVQILRARMLLVAKKTENPTQGHRGVNRIGSIISQSWKCRGRAVHLASSALLSLEVWTPKFYFISCLPPPHVDRVQADSSNEQELTAALSGVLAAAEAGVTPEGSGQASKSSVMFHRHFQVPLAAHKSATCRKTRTP